jgi:multisubunit Na+/H+ antiporter MnhE subunit
VNRLVRLLVWWAALFGAWLLFVGEWNLIEVVAGAIAALVAAGLALVVHELGLLPFRVTRAAFAGAASIPRVVVVDFWILTAALVRTVVRRKRVQGVFRAHPFDAGATGDDRAAARRAIAAALATYSPNAYVVDIDVDRGLVLLHDLVPNSDSESPA